MNSFETYLHRLDEHSATAGACFHWYTLISAKSALLPPKHPRCVYSKRKETTALPVLLPSTGRNNIGQLQFKVLTAGPEAGCWGGSAVVPAGTTDLATSIVSQHVVAAVAKSRRGLGYLFN